MRLHESGTPIILDGIRAAPIPLERINANQWTTAVIDSISGEVKASEKDLQDMLAQCPSLLPFQHFSSVFQPSVCIGREVPTGVGPIDCLFISGQGRVTLVETKLYKNPEARREVVAQLLDYCDQVSNFSFEQLEACAQRFSKERFPNYKYSGLKSFVTWQLKQRPGHSGNTEEEQEAEWVLDEQQFYSQVSRSVRRGEILGLIVGDHIDKRIISLADFAKSKPGLALELGIVELAFYRPSVGQWKPLLVVPQCLNGQFLFPEQ